MGLGIISGKALSSNKEDTGFRITLFYQSILRRGHLEIEEGTTLSHFIRTHSETSEWVQASQELSEIISLEVTHIV